jgi:Tfp pilus assembly protein PilF
MSKIITLVFTISLYSHAQSQNHPLSIIKEYKKVFKTYDFGDPDPIARLGPIYPYYRFDGYTDNPVNKEWKVVELENEFIKVMILPEIGGKIWAAWEKATGKPFIYYNQVVKFRDVAMRGPWTSGGIEANYGIMGHTPNCATPVDYLTEKKEDGSVSCTIGTLDLLTQTYWTLEINLPRDKGYFTTRSFWYNSTPLEQPYYTWMNAGIKAAGNLEFIYPGNRYIGHGGEYADWKINRENRKDISFYDENNFGGYKSYHVFGRYTDFFGAYWHREDFGMGRYAAHDEKAGKKIWIWGLSRQGMIWEKLLSDTDGQYVEVQSGRLFNQSAEESTFTPFKHRGFAPATSDSWTEYWFPVKDIKGFVQANPFGALNMRVEKGYLKINFSPLQDFKDDLKVVDGDQPVYSKSVTLKTLKAFSDSVMFKGNADNLTVTIGDAKMKYSTDPQEGLLHRPVDSPANVEWNSVQGLYIQGKENIQQRHYPQAEEKLIAALGKDPNYLPALADLSMLMYRKMEYPASLEYARHALSMDTYDPAGNFYYGLANAQLGNTSDAKDGFDIATLSGEYRGAAYLELSKIYFRENNYVRALHYANKSLSANSDNVEAYQIMALIDRLSNERDKAHVALEKLKTLNPLNHFIRFEEYRWDSSATTKNQFTSLIRNEMPQENYLQLADWYFSLGLANESAEVLNCAPVNAEVLYWMAYLKRSSPPTPLQGGEGGRTPIPMAIGTDGGIRDLIEKANTLSPALIFPFRFNSAEVLKWIISQTPNWKPKYYLALIYWSRDDRSRAKELFAQCGEPDFAPFYASRAALLNNETYAADIRKAAQLDPDQWRYGKLLIQHLIEKKNYGEALAIAKQYHTRFPRDFRLSMVLANTLLLNNQIKACIELLDQTTILPSEGATDGRRLYHEAWLMQAVDQLHSKNYKGALISINTARRWPESMGSGKPYDEDIDERLENYLDGICYEKTKNPDQARKKWNEIISFKKDRKNVNTLITAFALRQTNRNDEGEKLLSEWVQQDPGSKLARWCTEVYHGTRPDVDVEGDTNYRVIRKLLLNQ